MTLEQRHAKLVAYLLMKVEEKDWHGVSDAANDLRVLEAQMGAEPSADEILTQEELDQAFRKARDSYDLADYFKVLKTTTDERLRGVDILGLLSYKVGRVLGL